MAKLGLGDRLRLVRLATGHIFRSALLAIQTSFFYRLRYGRNAPKRLLIAPRDIRTADPTVAADIYGGVYPIGGATVDCQGASPFEIVQPSQQWFEALQGFGWLRHLHAANSDLARQHARAITSEWIKLCGRYDEKVWQPKLTARRLISWLSHSPLILNDAAPAFYRRFMKSLTAQVQYLHRNAPLAPDAHDRLTSAIALTMAGLSMAGRERLLRHAVQWLEDELNQQILPDGGHISRNPQMTADLLSDLLPLNQTFIGRDMAPPAGLQHAIDRMMPLVRFFRLGDGALARFNGTSSSRPDSLATLLSYDDTQGRPVSNARHSAFLRLAAGDTIIIADSGATPPVAVSSQAHAGALSFEMSDGANPLIINCGAPVSSSGDWSELCRTTAAHSTATINDTPSHRLLPEGWLNDRLGPLVLSGPNSEPATLEENESGILAALSHNGYVAPFNIAHRRRLALSADGLILQGEDLFSGPGGSDLPERSSDSFTIRFHLHPTVTAYMNADHSAIILYAQGTPSRKWAFQADGADISLEESVFLAGLDGPRRCEQILLSGRCSLQPRVSWNLVLVERDGDGSPVENTDADG